MPPSCGTSPCPPTDGDECPPSMLWGGPYPMFTGNVPPTQVKVWFDTGANVLNVWNWQTVAWMEVSPAVIVSATPPTGAAAPTGQLYIDGNQKLWVKVDDWKELTTPVANAPVIPNGVALVSSLGPPLTPAVNSLWFEPTFQNLYLWSGLTWIIVGTRVVRNVRIGSYANAWNAGGNRAQAESAGNFLYVAGIRGINPLTQLQVPGPGPLNAPGTVPPNTAPDATQRINQVYTNIKTIVNAEGISLTECMGLDTYLASNAYISPTANLQAQAQFWGLTGPFPNRTHITMIQMSGSDVEAEYGAAVPGWPARGDVVEVTSVFWLGGPGAGMKRDIDVAGMANELASMPGVHVGTSPPMPKPPQPGDPDPLASVTTANGNGNGNHDEDPEPEPEPRSTRRRKG